MKYLNSKTFLLLVTLLIGYSLAQNGTTIRVIRTARDSQDRLTEQQPIEFQPDNGDNTDVTIRILSNETKQKIFGFGGAFTEASAYVYSLMNSEIQSRIMEMYWGADGLNYTMGRIPMNSCDFSRGSYSYCDTPNDYGLESWDPSHDREILVPFIRRALNTSAHPIKLFGSPWSPPAWMKGNGQMTSSSWPGLINDPQIHQSWALYFSKWIDTMNEQGVPIWGMTVQNEPEFAAPWEACTYSPEQQRDFIKNYLGPKLRADHPDVKLITYDHNKDHIADWARVIFGDEETSQYVDGIGFHWYSGPQFENVFTAHEEFPNKFYLPTEACNCPVKLGDWGHAEYYGYNMIGDLNSFACGWTDWNLVLDTNGGPNHLGGNCDAHLIVDTQSQRLHIQPSYYYMGHFTRYIDPESTRIATWVTPDNGYINVKGPLQVTAARTMNNVTVAVVMNRNDHQVSFKITDQDNLPGMSATYQMPPHSIVTLAYEI